MFKIELGDQVPDLKTALGSWGVREAVQTTAAKVTVGVATESVVGEQDTVGEHDQAEDAQRKSARGGHQGFERIIIKNNQDHHGKIKEVAVHVLENQRKFGLTGIFVRSVHVYRTGWRGEEIRAVISFPVVVAGGAESGGIQRINIAGEKCHHSNSKWGE